MAKKQPLQQPADALSPLDLVRMQLNQRTVEAAQLRYQMAKKNLAHAGLMGELNAARLEAQTQRNLEHAKGAEAAMQEQLEAATAQSRILAEDMAKRYAVDWRTATFDSETGAIMRLPGDT